MMVVRGGVEPRTFRFQAGAPSPVDWHETTAASGRAVATVKGRVSSVTFPGAGGYELGEWRSCSACRPGTSWGTWWRYWG
jgi:hypothetical protein